MKIIFSNKVFYTLTAIFAVVLLGAGVMAWANSAGVGHSYSELQPCGANQILQTNSAGTAWECGTAGTGTSQWLGTTNIYYSAGNVGIGSSSSPHEKLHIFDGTSPGIVLTKGTTNTGSNWKIEYDGTNLNFFKSGACSTCWYPRLVIDNFGNMGIGTAPSTSYKLNIVGGANADSLRADNIGIGTASTTNYKLFVNGYTKFNGPVGINVEPSSSYGLRVQGDSKFADNIGMGGEPEDLIRLKVYGDIKLTSGLSDPHKAGLLYLNQRDTYPFACNSIYGGAMFFDNKIGDITHQDVCICNRIDGIWGWRTPGGDYYCS